MKTQLNWIVILCILQGFTACANRPGALFSGAQIPAIQSNYDNSVYPIPCLVDNGLQSMDECATNGSSSQSSSSGTDPFGLGQVGQGGNPYSALNLSNFDEEALCEMLFDTNRCYSLFGHKAGGKKDSECGLGILWGALPQSPKCYKNGKPGRKEVNEDNLLDYRFREIDSIKMVRLMNDGRLVEACSNNQCQTRVIRKVSSDRVKKVRELLKEVKVKELQTTRNERWCKNNYLQDVVSYERIQGNAHKKLLSEVYWNPCLYRERRNSGNQAKNLVSIMRDFVKESSFRNLLK
ncbi:MAG: hypothetical protein R3B54_11120 [Bdellovibrionota bacterium]